VSSVDFDSNWTDTPAGKEKLGVIKAGLEEDKKAPLFRALQDLGKLLSDFAAPSPQAALTAYQHDVKTSTLSEEEISQRQAGVQQFTIELRQMLSRLLSGAPETTPQDTSDQAQTADDDTDKAEPAGLPSASDLDAVADEQKAADDTK
jgi:hypothetical protein